MSTPGRLAVVGLGPGDELTRTPEAVARVESATDLVGYGPYLDQIGMVRPDQVLHRSPNRKEADRARLALDLAAEGRDVVIVSSGDPGVFAMAAVVVEQLSDAHREQSDRWADVDVTIVAGITAATAAAARVGAPLGHDFCVMSLSDVLKPWSVVERRLHAAVGADFVVALYNPISRHRPWQLGAALEIVGQYRGAATPVLRARNVARATESVEVVELGTLDAEDVDMSTVLVIGSSRTTSFTDAHGRTWMLTPRSYDERSDAHHASASATVST